MAETASAVAEKTKKKSALEEVLEKKSRKIAYEVLESEKVPGSRWRYKVELAADDEKMLLDEVLKEFTKVAAMPGFRPGKAPVQLVRNRYDAAAREEMVKRIVPRLVELIAEAANLEALGDPLLLEYKSDKNTRTRIELAFEVRPSIELADDTLAGIEFETAKFVVDDAAVEKTLQNLREQHADFVPSGDDATFEPGDGLTYDADIRTADGSPAQGLNGSGLYATDIARRFPAQVVEALTGKKKGDSVELTVNQEITVMQGQSGPVSRRTEDVKYKLTILEVKKRKLPELTDDFAKDVDPEVNSAAELKAKVRKSLEESAEEQTQRGALAQIYATLRGRLAFEVPRTLVEQSFRRNVENVERRLNNQGSSLGYVDEATRNAFFKRMSASTEQDVRDFFIADAVCRKFEIEPTEDRIKEELQKTADKLKRKPLAVRAQLEKKKMWEQYVDEIRLKMTNGLLLEKAVIKYNETSVSEAANAALPGKAAEQEIAPEA